MLTNTAIALAGKTAGQLRPYGRAIESVYDFAREVLAARLTAEALETLQQPPTARAATGRSIRIKGKATTMLLSQKDRPNGNAVTSSAWRAIIISCDMYGNIDSTRSLREAD
jgi:hypothetical protein